MSPRDHMIIPDSWWPVVGAVAGLMLLGYVAFSVVLGPLK